MLFVFYLSIFVFSFQRHCSAKVLTGSAKVDVIPISTKNFGQVWSPNVSYGVTGSNVFNDIASYVRINGSIKNVQTEPGTSQDTTLLSKSDNNYTQAKDYMNTLLKSVFNNLKLKNVQPDSFECGVEAPLNAKNLYISAVLKADRYKTLIFTHLRTSDKKLGMCLDYTKRKIASLNIQSSTQWDSNCRSLVDLGHHFDQACTTLNTFHSQYISNYLDGIWMDVNARIFTQLAEFNRNGEANTTCKFWNFTKEIALNSNAILALGLFVKRFQTTFSPCVNLKNRLFVFEVSKQFQNGINMIVSIENTKKIRMLWKEPSPSGGIWLIDAQTQIGAPSDAWKLCLSRVFEL